MIDFINLGLKNYKEAWDFQESIFKEVLDQKLKSIIPKGQSLIFCEHNHVYTLGKSGSKQNLLMNEAQLKMLGVEYYKINRGGDITYHGPGQLVGYPIIDLEQFNLGIHTYIEKMEQVMINILSLLGIKSERLDGATGVWIDTKIPGKTRKICAIGVRASRHITMHGFALNINTDLSYFDRINPCGFTDKQVTSIEKELGHQVDFADITQMVKIEFSKLFGWKYS